MESLESLDDRHLGPPDHRLSHKQGSMDRQGLLHPGIAPATFEASFGSNLNNETDRLEEVHKFSTAKGQPRESPEIDSAESTQDDEGPLAESPAFVYTCKSTPDILSILNEEPINIETKTQKLAA